MMALEQYQFLNAAFGDYDLLKALVERRLGTDRHAVMLMYDVLEFTLYEILLLHGTDIYRDGQHTIGIDSAIKEYVSEGYTMPFIGVVRRIQKLRGDAKHHAQTPNESDYAPLLNRFNVVFSRLVHEHFGEALEDELSGLDLVPYHSALYECYRRYRNHNWTRALPLGIAALLHKHRKLVQIEDDYRSIHGSDVLGLVSLLEGEIGESTYDVAPKWVVEFLEALPDELRSLFGAADTRAAAELAGEAYSRVEEVVPAIFDIASARRLTERLYHPESLDFRGGMMWAKWHIGDTDEKRDCGEKLEDLLGRHPEFVKTFGRSYYEEDEDRRWEWWEFAIFDGARWHSFHLDTRFEMSLEAGGLDAEMGVEREVLAQLILGEFKQAVEQFVKDSE